MYTILLLFQLNIHYFHHLVRSKNQDLNGGTYLSGTQSAGLICPALVLKY